MGEHKERRNQYSRYDQKLLDRIDNMKSASDYSPYDPIKKQSMSNNDLFDNEMYDDANKDITEADGKLPVWQIALAVVLLVVASYLVYRFIML